eukprot:TRINITY_DN36597_c0_g1_i1.p1 TRINITY_DN36597_c0_g1~~TRINITY_DN36597_c0_g1_i1.p1  ORF type:complete len:591 (-),score=114.94 TRINITY_DN36597_c0_g1_i1:122-1894(-)
MINLRIRPSNAIFAVCVLVTLAVGSTHAETNPGCWDSTALSLSPSLSKSTYPNCQVLSNNIAFYWRADTTGKVLYGAVHALRIHGWVAIGFSADGAMRGMDALVYRQVQGKYVLEDRWSDDFTAPTLDESQDATLVSGGHDDTKGTYFEFKRPIESCDPHDLPIASDVPMHVMWAFGNNHAFVYHGPSQRGTKPMYLIGSAPTTPAFTSSTKSYSIIQPTFNIPPKQTYYSCSSHALPSDKKRHVIGYEPVFSSSKVHHMIAYLCPKDVGKPAPFDCNQGMQDCVTFWVGWAVGGGTRSFPAEAALEMGETTKYVMLEIHYDNPSLDASTVDTGSGFILKYQDELRQYEIGTLTLGAINLKLAPGKPAVAVQNECVSACTKKYIPDSGINILSNAFHMHTLGRRSWTEVVRNGKEISPLGTSHYYHFNYQNPSAVVPGTKLYPGDRLITHCVFNTTGRTEVTTFGEGTSDEMCLNFVSYYPRIPMTQCFDIRDLADGFLVAYCAKGGYVQGDETSAVAAEQQTSRRDNLVFYGSDDIGKYTNRSRTCRESAFENLMTLVENPGGSAGNVGVHTAVLSVIVFLASVVVVLA